MATTFEQVCQLLEPQFQELGWDYSTNPDPGLIGFVVEGLSFAIHVDEQGELLNCFVPHLVTVSDDHPHAPIALETLLAMGWEMKLVRWQRDPDEGIVSATVEVPLEDNHLSQAQLERAIQGLVDLSLFAQQRLQVILQTGEDPGFEVEDDDADQAADQEEDGND